MAIVFVGHGGRDPNEEIEVPPGVAIKFFVDYDLNMDPTNAEAVLSRADFGSPNQTYVRGAGASPARVPNYNLGPLTSEELQADMSAARSLENVIWTEDSTWLCTDPDNCDQAGAHSCDGILGQAAGRGETDVVFLACRGVIGAGAPMSSRLGPQGGDDSPVPEMDTWVAEFLANAQVDPAGAAQQWDGLPEATRAMLLTYNNIRAWSEARESTDPSAPAAVLEAKRYLESHGALALADWADQWDPDQWSVAMADPDIAAAYQAGLREREAVQRRELLGDGAGAAADEVSVAVATAREQLAAFTSATGALTGTEDDANAVAELGIAYGALMEQLQLVDGLARQRADAALESATANSYDAGAAVGPELAAYGENLDQDNLAKIVAAVEVLNQWVASIPA